MKPPAESTASAADGSQAEDGERNDLTDDLVKELKGNIVGVAVLIELCFLSGRDRFQGIPVHSVIKIYVEGPAVATDF